MVKMVLLRKTLYLVVALCAAMSLQAERWKTYFAYNNVTQIALSEDKAYGLSDGSLFSVDKQTEQITIYGRQSGLHGTGITCIHYDRLGRQLLIAYGTGKIDILTSQGVQYMGELYDKDMTQRKTIYNMTIVGRTAYLATHYGIQTIDLRENRFVDSYWLRGGGEETPIMDVLIANDSIYAFGEDSLFCASMASNLVDYTVWRRELRSSRIKPDSEKGKHYTDATDHWYASNAEGIVRFTPTERIAYKPQGPYNNIPYSLTTSGKGVWMVPGGRWDAQYNIPGVVMWYDGNRWTNIITDSIRAVTQKAVKDLVHVAVDPNDRQHFYVVSYGTGLYEFRGKQLVNHHIADGTNSLTAIIASNPAAYTRLDYVQFDADGHLWMTDAALSGQLQCLDATGQWHAVDITAGNELLAAHTPGGLIIDRLRPDYKWFFLARFNTGICLLDDGGTRWDTSDDRTMLRSTWTDQHGHAFQPGFIFSTMQDATGRIWIGTDIGVAYIAPETDFFTSDAIIRPDIMDNNGENPMTTLRVNALSCAPDGSIWVGTETMGVYGLDKDATLLTEHYTTDNSAMPSNGILSLACDADNVLYIGTGEGLVSFDPYDPGEGLKDEGMKDEGMNEGSMLNWRLHLSYSDAQQIAATPKQVYAVANGSLFRVDRATDEIECLSKATGLTGTSVTHIAYDANAGQLIVSYENGQIDLISDDGDITPMTDISMKAGSVAVTINNLFVGKTQTYLAMTFGIIAIQPRKGEVTDTYYIGTEAASVDVQQVAELGDSLYAFSFDRLYKASLKDNIVDYSYWSHEALPFEQADQIAVHRNALYVLANNLLYRREQSGWRMVTSTPLKWIHAGDGKLLAYVANTGLMQLLDDDTLKGLSNSYVAADGVFTNGEYWLAEQHAGLVRLGTDGDSRFRPEGPLSNFGYHLDIAHDRLYVAPGGRWSEQFGRQSSLSIYDGTQWTGIPWQDTWYYTGHDIRDAVQYAVDATDPGHFFVTTYGTGVFEFKNYKAVQHYDSVNSTLRRATPTTSDYYYTRTDGATMDEQGNLWVLNATSTGKPVHLRTPQGQWLGLRVRANGTDVSLTTPSGIWQDRRKSQWKWFFDQRVEPRVFLLDDGGTPTVTSDDRCVARSTFVDQNGNTLSPAQFKCWAQDHTNRIWLGTDRGILLLQANTDFFSSNACRRIIIPRNDGTGLGDYLLGDEQINCIAVDGGNRIWIGTANSGLYLIEDDTITVAHFTETNSLLPSNNILSIAIMPKTGEVFVGTANGIASYRSDASEAKEDMSGIYAYPNPVRPDYGGYISVCGLMENTVVNIIDAGGNLVCKTRSQGGTAVWDGKLPDGRRATPGVYTALCNASGGHAVVKILVIR